MVNDTLIEAFHTMWDFFPESVMLVDKERNIIAANPVCESIGLATGMKCSQFGPPEAHKGCLANQALLEQKTIYTKVKLNGREFLSYWMPVKGKSDLFLHFSVGGMIDL